MKTTGQRVGRDEPDVGAEVRKRLLGAWTLVSYTATSIDGEVIHPLGRTPYGLIVHTHQGYMSAQLGCGDRAPMSAARFEDAPPDEMARAALSYLAYGGPFDVIDPETVEHHVTSSLFPNRIGRTLVRKVSFDGSFLRLGVTTPAHPWGTERTAELIWSAQA